jgi:hypothetical protein
MTKRLLAACTAVLLCVAPARGLDTPDSNTREPTCGCAERTV